MGADMNKVGVVKLSNRLISKDYMHSNLSLDDVVQEVIKADAAISNTDSETFKAWLKHKVKPVQWEHKQYALDERFWVFATLNNSCLYFKCIEEG